MQDTLPRGVVPLDDTELAGVVGGAFWSKLAAAAAAGFKAGQWLFCATRCFIYGY